MVSKLPTICCCKLHAEIPRRDQYHVTLLDGLGAVVGVKILQEIGLNVYLILAPVRAIWYAVTLIKRRYKGGFHPPSQISLDFYWAT